MTRAPAEPRDAAPRSRAGLAALAIAAALVVAGLVALGLWQVDRRAWKHALIARVERRIHAAPVPGPGPAEWHAIDEERAGYRRIVLRGQYLPGRDTRVQATTARGAGHWILTPFVSDSGFIVLVNRGFANGPAAPPPAGPVAVTGLLRITEAGGGFLRANDPAADRWYSRDVAAIAAARALSHVAPYFIDADAAPGHPGTPIGGMTVVRFADSHLVYALTWFALAAMVAGGYALVMREDLRSRRRR